MKTIATPIAIVGRGLSGRAAERLLRQQVPSSQLTTFDASPAAGAAYHDPEKLLRDFAPQTLVVSPGVPLSTPWIKNFKGLVTSEINLAVPFLEKERLIGVTGSLGKSTTVSLLEAGAKSFDPHAFAGGNLGTPLATYVADVLEKKRPRAQWIILELSSFQLENAAALALDFAALTYLAPNHLERYVGLEEYFETKWNLVKQCRGPVLLNPRGGDLKNFAALHPSPQLQWAEPLPEQAQARLLGGHNRDNLALAFSLARAAHWPEPAFSAMLNFGGLPHRLENVGERRGVRFINDSKATAIESVLTAVAAAEESTRGQVWVLLGGRDKKLPWENLSPLSARAKKLRFVFFGECAELAQQKSGLEGERQAHLKEALSALTAQVQAGDTVLLSPGGSSLDEFRNFEDRGQAFARWVQELF